MLEAWREDPSDATADSARVLSLRLEAQDVVRSGLREEDGSIAGADAGRRLNINGDLNTSIPHLDEESITPGEPHHTARHPPVNELLSAFRSYGPRIRTNLCIR